MHKKLLINSGFRSSSLTLSWCSGAEAITFLQGILRVQLIRIKRMGTLTYLQFAASQ